MIVHAFLDITDPVLITKRKLANASLSKLSRVRRGVSRKMDDVAFLKKIAKLDIETLRVLESYSKDVGIVDTEDNLRIYASSKDQKKYRELLSDYMALIASVQVLIEAKRR